MNETSSEPLAAGPPAASPAEVPAQPAERRLPIEFNGTGGEYFRIWIVNLLLTIITIGIYSAWAKVRRLRYFYGNTVLDGVSFDYHGKPLAILKGRLIAFGAYLVFIVLAQFFPLAALAFVPLIVFGVPWVIMKARLFQMRMSSYRGLRFNFRGTYGGALGAYIGWFLLAVITLYILLPLWTWKRVNYLLGNASYGTEPFRFTTSRGRFFAFVFASLGLMLLLIFGLGMIFALSGIGAAANADPNQQFAALLNPASVSALVGLVVFGLFIAGYFQKSLLNASFGGLAIGPHRIESRLQTWPLVGIYVSNLVLIVLTLGLFYPWAKVRQAKYQLTNLSVVARGDLDQFTASAGRSTDAIGEEVGDFFDVDFGL